MENLSLNNDFINLTEENLFNEHLCLSLIHILYELLRLFLNKKSGINF